MIPITKPFMPPKEEYEKYLDGVWSREYLTNNGPLVQELENRLKKYLDVKYLTYVSNGTIALQIAIKALGLSGEIITTPFSYIATTTSIVWEGCIPVYVDIDPNTLNINPNLIEDAITDKTSAILATHVFGNPCDIDAIKEIADRHSLKIIYDAAHCFGTKYKGRSVFEYGDISSSSFHATKPFHTVEGGAIFTKKKRLSKQIQYMRNFGHTGPEPFYFNGVGINGKNSEFHAAMGLCNLNYIDQILSNRRKQCEFYNENLGVNTVKKLILQTQSKWNHAYYPVIFENESMTLKVKKELEKREIYPRRYFYPSLETLHYVHTQKVEESQKISRRILCLPLFEGLKEKDQELIVKTIKNTI